MKLQCIKTIRDLERCTYTTREILNLIEEKMLQTEPEKRDNINLICRKLKQIQDSIPEDAEPPALKNPADIPLPSSVPDLIDVSIPSNCCLKWRLTCIIDRKRSAPFNRA
jgi:hypothetical protein